MDDAVTLRIARPTDNLTRIAEITCWCFFIPRHDEWESRCARMIDAGFREVQSYNPYWDVRGRTFEDVDGYRVVLQNDVWGSRP